MHHHWIILLCACLAEAITGYPNWLYARIRHPVVWIGACINALDRHFNSLRLSHTQRRAAGLLAMALLLALTLGISLAVTALDSPLLTIIAMASLMAQRSLYDHVKAVYAGLRNHSLPDARMAVSRIVGRDTAALDTAAVTRAAIESLAESFSDGVAAPLFWAACFGLPGIACYKAINTADSMIGHKNERYLAFGWAAARLDDAANLIPARLSALLLALSSPSHARAALRCAWRDAGKHTSPNAGWSEAAMAGALALTLGGTNTYDGIPHPCATLGDGTREATPAHLRRALRLYLTACALLWLILAATALITCR
jgi:adenosylcobinamide-phosphate synthase